MARPAKRKIDGEGGRVTKPGASSPSGRYTAPQHHEYRPSPTWVPVLMFAFIGLGFLAIFLNYTGVLPGSPNGWYLVGGLGGILAGIITATQLR
jgi:hypothetical protein